MRFNKTVSYSFLDNFLLKRKQQRNQSGKLIIDKEYECINQRCMNVLKCSY